MISEGAYASSDFPHYHNQMLKESEREASPLLDAPQEWVAFGMFKKGFTLLLKPFPLSFPRRGGARG